MRRLTFALLSSLLFVAGLAMPMAAAAAPPPEEPPAAPDQLLVGYEPGASASERADARARASAQLLERVVRGTGGTAEVELVRLPAGASRDGAIRRLESDPNVVYAEPNWLLTPDATSDDPYYTGGSLWGMYGDATTPTNQYGSQAGEAWAGGNTGSSTVVVGVIDTGIDVSHPDLAANIWVNPFDPVDGKDNDGNGYTDDVHGWDFYYDDSSVYDGGNGDKHGTHVAGTIAGVGGNTQGVAGVAWQATMISAKFLGPNGGYTSDAVKAVDYLTDLKKRHEINVVASNNSWGGGGYSSSLAGAIDRARQADILFVASAGNKDSDNDATPHYPSSYGHSNVISVASITSSGAKSSFSNWGEKSVDLGAPGSSIYSTLPGNTYGSYSGTSMAAPHVTGATVLAAANGTTGAVAIKDAIFASTVATSSMNGITVTGGRLNVSGFVTSGGNTAPVADDDSYSTSEDVALTVAAPGVLEGDTDGDGDPLTAVLAAGPGNGTVSLSSNGSFTYTPSANFAGTDSFTYQASDGTSSSNTATVTITVGAVDDDPVATNDVYTMTVGTTLTVAAPGVLGNDDDADGDPLTAALVDGSVSNGTVDLLSDGSFTFTPAAAGPASFKYTASDGSGPTSTATVSIDVATASDSKSTPYVHFSVFGGKKNDNHVDAQVIVKDEKGNPVSGAVVTADVNGSSRTATTDNNGVATMAAYRNVPKGFKVTTTVTYVDSTPPWDGTTPSGTYEKT